MSKIFNFSGEDGFLRQGPLYSDLMETGLVLSTGHKMGLYFPPCKRSRIHAPLFISEKILEGNHPYIEILPDECLFEIFRRLPGAEEKSACACVSKRWLMLLSSIRAAETCNANTGNSSGPQESSISVDTTKSFGSDLKSHMDVEVNNVLGDGYLTRCLEGKKATDVRLAAIAVGVQGHGGLGKLSIRGSNSGLSNSGFKAIACGCPSLRALSMWSVSTVGDEGIIEIANGCQLLEKLELRHCPAITDKSLEAIAKNCPKLTSLIVESCSNIGNKGLQAIARSCPNLRSITLKNCSAVGDQGVASLFSLAGYILTKVRLEGLNISDVSLAVIGHFGSALTDLVLSGLQHVNERGFWVMGHCKGLANLQSFAVTACRGLTDVGLEAVGRGSPNLKRVCLRKCALVSDNGLVSFSKVADLLESLQLDECHRITQFGIVGVLVNCGVKLKSLSLDNCFGFRDFVSGQHLLKACLSLRSLSISNCPGFGNASLLTLAKLCPNLVQLELNALNNINDEGLLPLVENPDAALVKVKLSGCINLTDEVASAIVKLHGGTLELLNLDGCRNITDASLWAIAEYCSLLSELDVSNCRITDVGLTALASNAVQLSLRVLSFSGCSLVSDKSLPYLEKFGGYLVGLNIQHCHGISRGAVDLLLERLVGCDVLS